MHYRITNSGKSSLQVGLFYFVFDFVWYGWFNVRFNQVLLRIDVLEYIDWYYSMCVYVDMQVYWRRKSNLFVMKGVFGKWYSQWCSLWLIKKWACTQSNQTYSIEWPFSVMWILTIDSNNESTLINANNFTYNFFLKKIILDAANESNDWFKIKLCTCHIVQLIWCCWQFIDQ